MAKNSSIVNPQKRYQITLTGVTPLLMHKDNYNYTEDIKKWQKAPENKQLSTPGSDLSPMWIWLGYTYHDGRHFSMDTDCIMTCIREAGAKVPTGAGKKGDQSYKRITQSYLVCDSPFFDLYVDGKQIPVEPFKALIGNNEFVDHNDLANEYGFELFVKRAKVGMAKHVRVRPMFRNWQVVGTITVLDEETSGLTKEALEMIFAVAGGRIGLCDWRPSSPKSPGTYGKFDFELTEI